MCRDIRSLFKLSVSSAFLASASELLEAATLQQPLSTSHLLSALFAEAAHYKPFNLCSVVASMMFQTPEQATTDSSSSGRPVPLRWTDIGGYDEVKHLLQESVQDRLANRVDPDSWEYRLDDCLGLSVPRGILLHGPPGEFATLSRSLG
ncbi:unnamed protein product [Protopolystoma xenopodis]|uniref:ATPase AAA-type core domain-containing protein n=1 Tax=Protopolystoma xenopodis TaxID=117903 RepID=A0A448XI07_9PLAT|nr:unnamed protein product [Protopolystoma xenopodis]